MDDFAKFQPHQIADDKIMIIFGPQFFVSCSFPGPFDYALNYPFNIRIFSVDLSCFVGMWSGLNMHITKSKFYRYV